MLYALDLDDTLYLECDYVRSGFFVINEWIINNKGVHGFLDRAWCLFENGIRGNIFDIVLKELKIFDKDLVKYFVKLYRNHIPDIKLQKDALTFLETHSPEDLVLITDGFACSQRAKIQSLQLEKYINKIIVTDEWGVEYWKPHQRAFIEAQGERLSKDCVYVGDNPKKDFIAPNELEWVPSIRICRKKSLHRTIDTPRNCIEITSLSENFPY